MGYQLTTDEIKKLAYRREHEVCAALWPIIAKAEEALGAENSELRVRLSAEKMRADEAEEKRDTLKRAAEYRLLELEKLLVESEAKVRVLEMALRMSAVADTGMVGQ